MADVSAHTSGKVSIEECPLPESDMAMSTAVLGTMTWGSQIDERAGERMLRTALEHGVTTVDTANKYGDGQAEQYLGRIMGKMSEDDLLVCSKVGHPSPALGGEAGLSRSAVSAAIDASLRRLRREVIDIYLLHMPDRSVPIDETLEALSSAVQAGKIRAIGHSNYAGWQAVDMAHRCQRRGWPVPQVSQPMYNLIARRIESEYLDAVRAAGLVNMVYNPLAGGLLTGKHRMVEAPPPGRFERNDYRDRYWSEPQFVAVERLRGIAADAGLSLVELSLRWLQMQAGVDAIVVGASTPEQLRGNLDAMDGPALDVDTLDRCDAVWAALAGVAPSYNR